jgi:hypothetical protein
MFTGSRPTSPTPVAPPLQTPESEIPPPPASSVNVYELTFGTVAGICAGVFIKKGAKAVAFFLGGVFVLLQVSLCCSVHYSGSSHRHDTIAVLWFLWSTQGGLGEHGYPFPTIILHHGPENGFQGDTDDLFIVEMAGRFSDC